MSRLIKSNSCVPLLNIFYKKIYNKGPFYFNELLLTHSISGRNKCMCCISHALCYGRVRSCAIHNFASHGRDVIRACRVNNAECQWTRNRVTMFEGKKNPVLSCFCSENSKVFVAFKTYFDETKRFLS